MKIKVCKHFLRFKKPAGTSRGVLLEKPTYYICIEENGIVGIGEFSLIPHLSIDDLPHYEAQIQKVCSQLAAKKSSQSLELEEWPSIKFGIETALLDLQNGGRFLIFDNCFYHGSCFIPINGLIWMGSKRDMQSQVRKKFTDGFRVIKLKIGAIDTEEEFALLKWIRQEYGNEVELRVDANGAFSPEHAPEILERLAELQVHSIEQPIKAGQPHQMAGLCATSPTPIALDEELIGITSNKGKLRLLETIRPQYIILKPSLLGGLQASDEWIAAAEKLHIGWWATSALESNIGLNAIAQWAAGKTSQIPQGLGTGQLFTNNINSPLQIADGQLFYNQHYHWNMNLSSQKPLFKAET